MIKYQGRQLRNTRYEYKVINKTDKVRNSPELIKMIMLLIKSVILDGDTVTSTIDHDYHVFHLCPFLVPQGKCYGSIVYVLLLFLSFL